MTLDSSEVPLIAQNVRNLSGVRSTSGPSDENILAAVTGFVKAFDYWYIRVMREAVPQYRTLIIKRINPFIRIIEFEGLAADDIASRLVEDYNSRNFVTAGGWALEEMAVAVSPTAQKSSTAGIDFQRVDQESGAYHLYVLKSGLVTRNSDILKSLKQHARQAEKLLRQGRATVAVTANYAIAAGKTGSTFEDGIRRPSSAEFWSEMTGLDQRAAVDLAFAIAAEAGRLVRRDASKHISALKFLVREYIGRSDDRSVMDWDFIKARNMQQKEAWSVEDRRRHAAAMTALLATGYDVDATEHNASEGED